jgi:23S rRNA pseudouridine1911/1915/1917 synthase
MSEEICFRVSDEDGQTRVDILAAQQVEHMTRSAAALLCEQGRISVNGAAVKKNARVKPGDAIVISLPDPKPTDIQPENIPLDILYEDGDLLVVNKPRGMVVHPSFGHEGGTLVNALMFHCGDSLSGINGELRPGIVHRIDKDTGGLLLVAKNDQAHGSLAAQIASHSLKREYAAVVQGVISEAGTVHTFISRDPKNRLRMAVNTREGKEAVTHYEPAECHEGADKRLQNATYLKLRLQTGRTHQIRVHMAYIRHPVLGDPLYGNGKPAWLAGQCLHARTIGFIHPKSGAYMEFSTELPEYFTKLLRQLTV